MSTNLKFTINPSKTRIFYKIYLKITITHDALRPKFRSQCQCDLIAMSLKYFHTIHFNQNEPVNFSQQTNSSAATFKFFLLFIKRNSIPRLHQPPSLPKLKSRFNKSLVSIKVFKKQTNKKHKNKKHANHPNTTESLLARALNV